MLLIFLFILLTNIRCFYLSCLDRKEKVQWTRKFHYQNKHVPLVIEVTSRPSHIVLSNIIKILLEERLGYINVVFNYQKWDNFSDILKRLSCSDNCSSIASHINMEVWMSPGYTFNEIEGKYYVSSHRLGPTVRKGIFIPTDDSTNINLKQVFSDSWQYMTYNRDCNSSQLCFQLYASEHLDDEQQFAAVNRDLLNNRFQYKNLKYSNANFYNLSIKPFYLNWYPNVETIQNNYNRILFPDCWDIQWDSSCYFEVFKLIKVISQPIKENAVKAFNLLKEFNLSQEEYVELLKNVNMTNPNKTLEYFSVACKWIKGNVQKWAAWIPDWNVKDKVFLPVLISDYGYWKASELFNASHQGIKYLNIHVFNNSNYEVIPIVQTLQCNIDDILQSFLQVIKDYDQNIIGFVVCLCPQTFNTVIKISDIESRILVSSSIESTYGMDVMKYRHFFSTQPNMMHYNLILIKCLHILKWKRVVILKKDSHLLDRNIFIRYNINILAEFNRKEENISYNETYQFLENAKKEHQASVFILDYLIPGTQIVMCAAGNLGMTLDRGYAFFINPFINPQWWSKPLETPCVTNNQSFSKDYFIIKHDTTSEHRENYFRTNVMKYDYLAQLTYDAIHYLGKSFKQLLNDTPSASRSWTEPVISKKYINFLMTQDQKMIGKDGFYRSKVFNNYRDRRGTWHVQQVASFYSIDRLIALPIYTWNLEMGLDRDMGLPQLREEPNAKIYWGQFNIRVEDKNRESDCPLEVIRSLFGWHCTTATIFVNLLCFVVIIAIILCPLILYYRHQARVTVDVFKKPFEDLCTELADIDIRSTDLIINIKVGKGAFGDVFCGEAKRNGHWVPVAIKLINKEADYQGKVDFLTEAKLMRSFEHANIVKLIGICLNPSSPVIYLVMELVVNGDLEDYLLSHRVIAQRDCTNKMVCPSLLSRFVKDIALGLLYLHNNGLLHRDLACRNCLLSDDYGVKIGDFGLTRPIQNGQENQYYRISRHFVLPVRWMPPEAIQFGYFSIQSDIWSFGVVIFEICTFGFRPYYNFNDEEVPELVTRNRMPLVNYLPESAKGSHVFKLIENCCKYKREERPESMQNIVNYLDENSGCIQPFLTNDPPKATSMNIFNFTNHAETTQRTSSLASVGISRLKSTTSRSKTSAGNRGIFSDSLNNFELAFNDSDTGFKEDMEQIPFIPSEGQFITFIPNSSRMGSKKKQKAYNKKNISNLNSSKSRSSDFMMKKIEDDLEPSYVSCPDNEPAIILCDLDPQDFPFYDDALRSMKSTSGESRFTWKQAKLYNGRMIYSGGSRNRKGKNSKHGNSQSKSKNKYNSSNLDGMRKTSEPNGMPTDIFQPLLFERSGNVLIKPEPPFKSTATTEIC